MSCFCRYFLIFPTISGLSGAFNDIIALLPVSPTPTGGRIGTTNCLSGDLKIQSNAQVTVAATPCTAALRAHFGFKPQ